MRLRATMCTHCVPPKCRSAKIMNIWNVMRKFLVQSHIKQYFTPKQVRLLFLEMVKFTVPLKHTNYDASVDISHGVETESDCWLLKTEEDMHSFMRLLLAPMKSSKVYTDLLRAKLMMLKKVEKAAAAAEQPDVVDEPATNKLRRTTKRGKKVKPPKPQTCPHHKIRKTTESGRASRLPKKTLATTGTLRKCFRNVTPRSFENFDARIRRWKNLWMMQSLRWAREMTMTMSPLSSRNAAETPEMQPATAMITSSSTRRKQVVRSHSSTT